jgi:hypothetical protein
MPNEQDNTFHRRSRSVALRTSCCLTTIGKIGPTDEIPNFDDAIETLARALFNEALARSGGNLSETGRLLGMSRSRACDLKIRLEGRPTRTCYGRAGRVSGSRFLETTTS